MLQKPFIKKTDKFQFGLDLFQLIYVLMLPKLNCAAPPSHWGPPTGVLQRSILTVYKGKRGIYQVSVTLHVNYCFDTLFPLINGDLSALLYITLHGIRTSKYLVHGSTSLL